MKAHNTRSPRATRSREVTGPITFLCNFQTNCCDDFIILHVFHILCAL